MYNSKSRYYNSNFTIRNARKGTEEEQVRTDMLFLKSLESTHHPPPPPPPVATENRQNLVKSTKTQERKRM
jgi:hypothetical protein